jgi:Asp/Glu/hydantoin racemase
VLLEHERILQQRYGLRSLTRCIPDQHNGIFDDQSEALAVPKIVEMGRELFATGCKALLLSGAAYPGLALLRAVVAMPVVSAGNSAARLTAHVGLPMR